jgi:hypothetical protein
VRRAQRRPFGPEGIAGPGIDHQADLRPDRLPRGPHDRLVGRNINPTKWSPPHLDCSEAVPHDLVQNRHELFRVVHQDGCVGLDALAIAAAEQATDRLARHLPEDVPQGDIDAGDGVGDRTPTPLPEGVLVEGFTRPFGLDGRRPNQQRLEHPQRRPNQVSTGEDRAPADVTVIGGDATKVWTQMSASSSLLQPPSGVAPTNPMASTARMVVIPCILP